MSAGNGRHSKTRRNVTIMCVMTACVDCAFITILLLVDLVLILGRKGTHEYYVAIVVASISNDFYGIVYSLVHFTIYALFDRNYRAELFKILRVRLDRSIWWILVSLVA